MDPVLAILYSSLPPLNRSNQPCGAPSDVVYFCWNLDWFNSNPNLMCFLNPPSQFGGVMAVHCSLLGLVGGNHVR